MVMSVCYTKNPSTGALRRCAVVAAWLIVRPNLLFVKVASVRSAMRGSVKGKKPKAPTLAKKKNDERWALLHSWAVELPLLMPEAMNFAASLNNIAVQSFIERCDDVYDVAVALRSVMSFVV